MGTVTQWLDPLAGRVFTTVAGPELIQANGTNFPLNGMAFDGAATIEAMFFEVFAVEYGASNPNLTLLIDFYCSATSNNSVLQAAISATTPGDAQSLLTDAFATATNSGAVANIGTANAHNRATITISNLDSLAPNDRFTLKVFRDPGNGSDNNTADVIIFGVTIQWPDT